MKVGRKVGERAREAEREVGVAVTAAFALARRRRRSDRMTVLPVHASGARAGLRCCTKQKDPPMTAGGGYKHRSCSVYPDLVLMGQKFYTSSDAKGFATARRMPPDSSTASACVSLRVSVCACRTHPLRVALDPDGTAYACSRR